MSETFDAYLRQLHEPEGACRPALERPAGMRTLIGTDGPIVVPADRVGDLSAAPLTNAELAAAVDKPQSFVELMASLGAVK